jgi:hypothetical protein
MEMSNGKQKRYQKRKDTKKGKIPKNVGNIDIKITVVILYKYHDDLEYFC